MQTGIKGEKLTQAPFKGIHFVGHSAANMKTQKEKAVLERKVQKFLNTVSPQGQLLSSFLRACFFLAILTVRVSVTATELNRLAPLRACSTCEVIWDHLSHFLSHT